MTKIPALANEKEAINQLLVFQIQEVSFGVDARQVSSIDEPQNVNQDEIQVLKLHEVIPFKDRSINYKSPKMLMVNTPVDHGAIFVEAPDDIIFLNASQIKPVPTLVSQLNVSTAIWGVFVRDGRTILVLDIDSLMAEGQKSKGKG